MKFINKHLMNINIIKKLLLRTFKPFSIIVYVNRILSCESDNETLDFSANFTFILKAGNNAATDSF